MIEYSYRVFVNSFPKFRLVCAVVSSHRTFRTATFRRTQNTSVPVITTGISCEPPLGTLTPVDSVGRNTESPREPADARDSAGNSSCSSRSSRSSAIPAGSARKAARSEWTERRDGMSWEEEVELEVE